MASGGGLAGGGMASEGLASEGWPARAWPLHPPAAAPSEGRSGTAPGQCQPEIAMGRAFP
jgi:hypothetical protein